MNTAVSPSHPAERLIAWAALACWSAAWFLPVIDDYSGWAAFVTAMGSPFRDGPLSGEDGIAQFMSGLTNLVFVVLLLRWFLHRLGRPAMFLKIAIACLVLNCYWLVQLLRVGEVSDLLIGYYVWLAAFALLVAVGVLNVVSARRTSRTPTAGTPA